MEKVKGQPRRSAPTPKGLELIEKGEMVHYHPEMYSNFNTVVLEGYLEEKNRERTLKHPDFSWTKLILLVVLVGTPYTFVTLYIALKSGMVISSLFYIAFLIGLALKWRSNEVNILSSATNLVDQTMIAFAYVFPVIFLLALGNDYLMPNGSRVIPSDMVPSIWIVVVVVVISTVASVLGLFHFIIYRKLWVVEEPLPTPGFESLVKLMDLTNSRNIGSTKAAVSSMKKVGLFSALTLVYAFLRDFPVNGARSVIRSIFAGLGLEQWLSSSGDIYVPWTMLKQTNIGLSLSGIYFSIGWYMRSKVALMVLAGSAFMWLVLVPMAFFLHLPYYLPYTDSYFDVNFVYQLSRVYPGIYSVPSRNAYMICMNVGIGTVLGAGLVAFLKVLPSVKALLFRRKAPSQAGFKGRSGDQGSYEWPSSKIPIVEAAAFVCIFLILLIVGGFAIIPSLIIAVFLSAGAFILHAIAVKVAGETGTGATTMMTCFSLIFLFIVLRPLAGHGDVGRVALLVLLSTTAFIASKVVVATVQWDYKTGLYIGTRPIGLFKAQVLAVSVGVPVCALVASVMAVEMARGRMLFEAPWPKVYSSMVMALSGGKIYYSLLLLGLFIGAVIELLTSKGTVFGLGMFFQIGVPLTILMGGAARDLWQKSLKRKYGSEKNFEEIKTLKLLDSYMVMTGIFLGEALMGLIYMVYYLLQ